MKLGIFYIIGSFIWFYMAYDLYPQVLATEIARWDATIMILALILSGVDLLGAGLAKCFLAYEKKRVVKKSPLIGK